MLTVIWDSCLLADSAEEAAHLRGGNNIILDIVIEDCSLLGNLSISLQLQLAGKILFLQGTSTQQICTHIKSVALLIPLFELICIHIQTYSLLVFSHLRQCTEPVCNYHLPSSMSEIKHAARSQYCGCMEVNIEALSLIIHHNL